jgi:hypothetical protein
MEVKQQQIHWKNEDGQHLATVNGVELVVSENWPGAGFVCDVDDERHKLDAADLSAALREAETLAGAGVPDPLPRLRRTWQGGGECLWEKTDQKGERLLVVLQDGDKYRCLRYFTLLNEGWVVSVDLESVGLKTAFDWAYRAAKD